MTRLDWIANFIWSIADDVLRDLYVRGKYRDVILPMIVLRRLDAVLEDTKEAVLDMRAKLDAAGLVNQDGPLRAAAGHAFYNVSRFTMRDLKARASAQQLRVDFEAYLDGFSPNVQDILDNFEFRNQIERLSAADALGTLIEKLTAPDINLSPKPVKNADGSVKLPGLDNHGMGTIFEELVRRFNEENNEEAGEHWTPRDAVKLMANLVFLPVAGKIESSTYLLYDGACGTGGMLTVAEETLQTLAAERGKQVEAHLYGQEINAETYAICKADLLLKGEGDAADNIRGGPQHSTLANDAFPSSGFDFMLSNPPYGKSWKSDLERMGGKDGVCDRRFVVEHAGDPEYSLLTRTSDGQMLFLANMLSKMKRGGKLGSRVAEVHNGSSLFTGDAGQGESNIRRWILENDWLEAVVALPLNMFYNTGIATYIWVLANRKPERRRGKVQLIDATEWFKPLRKNLGKKNCELADDDIRRICAVFLAFEETPQSKIFPSEAFGYWKVTVERPLRLAVDLSPERRARFRDACRQAGEEPLADVVDWLAVHDAVAGGPHRDFGRFMKIVAPIASMHKVRLTAKRKKLLQTALASRDAAAEPVVRKIHKKGVAPDPLRGLFAAAVDGKPAVVEYEPNADLRDTEQVPLLEDGGIEGFLRREALPYAPDAWYDPDSVKLGYEISFARHFYKPQPMRPLEEIRADILALERETEGLLEEQRRAVVHRAVTRGLDPNVRLKPSGVEWLGDVPAHWEVAALKYRYLQCLGKMLDSKRITGKYSIPYLRNVDVQWNRINIEDLPEMDIPPNEYNRYTVQHGDLLVCEGGEVGRCALWSGELAVCGFQKALHRLRPQNVDRDLPRFMYYVLRAAVNGNAFSDGRVSTIEHLTGDQFRAYRFPFPPHTEQAAIAAHLDKTTAAIDAAVARARRQVELLREYRARLIADGVTGKLDVREAAADLLDEGGAGKADKSSKDTLCR